MAAQFSDEDLIGPPLYELYLEVVSQKLHSRAQDVQSFVDDAITVPARQGTLTDQDLEQVIAAVAVDALSIYGMFYLFQKDTRQIKVDMSDSRLMFLGPENWLDENDDPWKLEHTIRAIAGALDDIELSSQTCPGLQYRVIQDALNTIRFVRHSISSTLRESIKDTTLKQTKNVQTTRESNAHKTSQDARTGSLSSSTKHPEQISTLLEGSKADQAAQDILIQQLQDKVDRQAELLQGHAALQAELLDARAANAKLRTDAMKSGASISGASVSLLREEVGIVNTVAASSLQQNCEVGPTASAATMPMLQQTLRSQSFGSMNAVLHLEQELHAKNTEISRLHVEAMMSSATLRADNDALTTKLQESQHALVKVETAKARWKDMVTHLVESGLVG
jgi:hypothetical protein